jgi:lipoprotein-anchoring transpeptidase ErfK/SrfK
LPEYDPEISHHPKFIKIYLQQQYEGCYEYGRLKYCFPVATGFVGQGGITVTPETNFTITGKERMHYSSLYHGAPMPFSMQLNKSNYFLHGGPVPGYPASKGCIRHFIAHAEILFGWAAIGTPGRTVGGKKGTF